MTSIVGAGCEDVRKRETKTFIHGCGPGQTWLLPSSKATSAFPQNPGATGRGREDKHNQLIPRSLNTDALSKLLADTRSNKNIPQ